MQNPSLRRSCWLYNLDVVPYSTAWEWQRSLVEARKHDPTLPDILLLLEHPPVYTLGQGSSLEFLKFIPTAPTVELHYTERGGEVTYHCPGQLVGYPILNLKHYNPDLHWYLRQLEEVLIQVLAIEGLKADRIPGLTGVWVDGIKVAAIGIKVSRWITMHGFALNICPDLSGFDRIVPCGIADKSVGSLQQFLPAIDPTQIRHHLIQVFSEIFNVELIRALPIANG